MGTDDNVVNLAAVSEFLSCDYNCTPVGLTLSPEWEGDGLDLKSIIVCVVENGSIAQNKQLHVGDEIVLVNDTSVNDMGWSEVQSLIDTGACSVNLIMMTHVQCTD